MSRPSSYIAGASKCWTGRQVDPSLGIQYWYQAVQPIDLYATDLTNHKNNIGLLGYACDEGVRRNQGRVGAAGGPDAIRSRLARVAWHHDRQVVEAGTITCTEGDLEQSQEELGASVYALLQADIFPGSQKGC